jgi:hypothetical protein
LVWKQAHINEHYQFFYNKNMAALICRHSFSELCFGLETSAHQRTLPLIVTIKICPCLYTDTPSLSCGLVWTQGHISEHYPLKIWPRLYTDTPSLSSGLVWKEAHINEHYP